MDSRTLLEQAVFQLTPTRTRCDLLVVSIDGKREKIASGLVAPFLTHLRSARDQIPKGGYSFSLRPPPPPPTPAAGGDFGLLGWFTKGVVEKFVRFVATPEIVERVVTIEKEIVEIDEEIDRTQLASSLNHLEVSGENSKQSLLLVHENRKKMLQKEQGMSYARACILGYERNHLDDLISFGDAFGASRFREACISFKELCFEKEKDNLWADELAALEALRHSQFSSMPNNGIILTAEADKNSIDSNDQNAGVAPDLQGKSQFPMGWFNHHPDHMYPYHGHMPANAAPFQGYPYPGMPFMPPYQTHYAQSQRHSRSDDESHVDRRISETGSEFGDNGPSEKKSNKKSSRKVVIRNINYISKGKRSESSDDSSYDEDEDIVDEEFLQRNVEQVVDSFRKHRHSNRRKHRSKSDRRNRSEEAEEDVVNDSGEKKSGGGGWDAFHSILMKDETETDQKPDVDVVDEYCAIKSDGLSRSTSSDCHHLDEELGKGRRQKMADVDPLVMNGRDTISEGGRRFESFEDGDDYCRSIINERGQNQNEEFLFSQTGNSKINTSLDNFANYTDESPSIQIRREADWLVVDEYNTKPPVKASSQDTLIFEQDLIQRSENLKKIERAVPSFDDSIVVPERSHAADEQRSSLWETDMSIISGLAFTPPPPPPDTSKDHWPVQDFQEPDDLQMVFRRDLEVQQVTEEDIGAEFTHAVAIEKTTPVELDANIVIKKEPIAKTNKSDTVKKTKQIRPPLTKRTESLPRNRKLTNLSKEAIQLAKAKQEEANRKRIEELNLERQKRIAERSGTSSTTAKTKQSGEAKGDHLAMERLKISQQNRQNRFGSIVPQRPSGTIRKI